MNRLRVFLWRLTAALVACGAAGAYAGNACDLETVAKGSETGRHFVVLAGRPDVFFERSGPTFVMLLRAAGDSTEVGAFGIHADAAGKPVFGAVPAGEYGRFLREEQDEPAGVMLRVEVSAAQYARVLDVLRAWERRVREKSLLYPDVAFDNILLVRQATEELNRCAPTLVPYALDWGLQDDISEHNIALRIPYEYFRELRRLNAARHVPDSDMPATLLE